MEYVLPSQPYFINSLSALKNTSPSNRELTCRTGNIKSFKLGLQKEITSRGYKNYTQEVYNEELLKIIFLNYETFGKANAVHFEFLRYLLECRKKQTGNNKSNLGVKQN